MAWYTMTIMLKLAEKQPRHIILAARRPATGRWGALVLGLSRRAELMNKPCTHAIL